MTSPLSVNPQPVAKPEKKEQEKITTDVSRLSHRAKLELLQKESPELLDLIDDYKTKVHLRTLVHFRIQTRFPTETEKQENLAKSH